MKRTAIIVLLLVGVGVFTLLSTVKDASTYEDFTVASENPDRDYHVVGSLAYPDRQMYDPATNPDLFEFWLKDVKGSINKVVLHKGRPADFDMSSKGQIVVIGHMADGYFDASEMLTKCPSKYEDEKKKQLNK